MNQPFNDDQEYQPPPTEAEWEDFLKRSDARSAKYAELLETLIDHPDRDAIIGKEMGWDSDDELDDFEGNSCSEATNWKPDDLFDEAFEESLPAEIDDELTDEDDDPFSFRESPIYHQAFEWGLKLHTELQPYLPESEELDPDEPLYIAFSECLIVAAKLAGCQAMCDDDDSLGGGIVYTRRALKAATDTLEALEELAEDNAMEQEKLAVWIADTREVCGAIERQIEELRSRVWWE